MPELVSFESLAALLTLTAMEIVLGIDNIVFIALLSNRVAEARRALARQVGLALAMITRIGLLLAISWTMRLTKGLFTVWDHVVSGRDLILLAGGLFLIFKATHEVHKQIEGAKEDQAPAVKAAGLVPTVIQIAILDIIFSLDSVITAVGMARRIEIMIAAIVIAVIVMIVFSGLISRFIERHPSLRILALAFLILVGVILTAEGLGKHIDRGYIYFAMAFSLGVEVLNLRAGARRAARKGAKA